MIPVAMLGLMLILANMEKSKTIGILSKVVIAAFAILLVIQIIKVFTTRDKVFKEL